MCLITNKKRVQTAKKDIVVYKVLRSTMKSYYFSYQYTLGELHSAKLKKRKLRDIWNAYNDVDEAWLSENYCGWNPTYDGKRVEPDYQVRKALTCIERGFHSVLNQDRLAAPSVRKGYVYECTIPKGSKYFTDHTDCIVSNQIIINKKIS